MSFEVSLRAENISKTYLRFASPLDRLKHQLFGERFGAKAHLHEALKPCSFTLGRGESLGIVGLNGAGKSTLLQLIAGTLQPSSGEVQVKGKVAALLELGSGFNPEFTGRENVYLNAATLGLSKAEIDARYDDMVAFAGLERFMDQPVKTYSSGMQVRLAFAVATSSQPDVLIIDEALSVGDGTFAKKSFDRIMDIRAQGASLLFCSHALFHVDLFCDKTLWLDQGQVRGFGPTREVLPQYQAFLDALNGGDTALHEPLPQHAEQLTTTALSQPASTGGESVRLLQAQVSLDGVQDASLRGVSLRSTLAVTFKVKTTKQEPKPRLAVVISDSNGKILASCFSPADAAYPTDAQGVMSAYMELARIPMNKGEYRVGAYVLCAQARYVYEWVDPVTTFRLDHEGPHQGHWIAPGEWRPSP